MVNRMCPLISIWNSWICRCSGLELRLSCRRSGLRFHARSALTSCCARLEPPCCVARGCGRSAPASTAARGAVAPPNLGSAQSTGGGMGLGADARPRSGCTGGVRGCLWLTGTHVARRPASLLGSAFRWRDNQWWRSMQALFEFGAGEGDWRHPAPNWSRTPTPQPADRYGPEWARLAQDGPFWRAPSGEWLTHCKSLVGGGSEDRCGMFHSRPCLPSARLTNQPSRFDALACTTVSNMPLGQASVDRQRRRPHV